MIRVVRIAGESYDLETGATRPKEVVLSNGHREVGLPVDDEKVQDLLMMAAEIDMLAQLGEKEGLVEEELVTAPNGIPVPRWGGPSPSQGNGGAERPPDMSQLSDEMGPHDHTHEGPVTYEPESDEEYEPGEEYNDPATGVGSL